MFDRIPGQQPVKDLFERALRDGGVGHAYLFCGPEGLAKTEFARELGVALVAGCGGCGECDECERARRGLHPDLRIVEPEGAVIRIDQIKSIIEDLALKPFIAKRRVWVISQVEDFHEGAANKLLKSIEEPPANVHFLLVTDRIERVLPTIVSRCQLIECRPVGDREVLAYLEREYGMGGAQAEALARLAAGSVERAARFAADARGADRRGQYLRFLGEALSASDAAGTAGARQAFVNVLTVHLAEIKDEAAERLAARTAELERQFEDVRDREWQTKRVEEIARREKNRLTRLAAVDALDTVAAWTRDLWVVACGASEVLWNSDRGEQIVAAAVASPEHYRRLIEAAAATRKDLYLNIDFELAFKAMFSRFEEVARSA